MNRFQVGDRVRIVRNLRSLPYRCHINDVMPNYEGMEGVIKQIHDDSYFSRIYGTEWYVMYSISGPMDGWYWWPETIERAGPIFRL